MRRRAGRRPSCGTWTAPSSTPSRTGSRPSSPSPRTLRRHLERGARPEPGRQRPDQLRALHPRAHGHRPGARRDRRAAARRRRRARAGPGARGARVPSSCWRTCDATASRAPWSRCPTAASSSRSWPPCPRHLRRGRHRRRRLAREAAPGAVPEGRRRARRAPEPTAWPSRTPTPVPAVRSAAGLRRVLVVPNHVPVLEGERRVFARHRCGGSRRGLAARPPGDGAPGRSTTGQWRPGPRARPGSSSGSPTDTDHGGRP